MDLLGRSDDELLVRHGRWYVPRRQARYLRRNALVVLSNVGDGRAPAVVAAVATALAEADPIVRGAAAWAAVRLGLAELAEGALAGEEDPDVLDELAAARAAGPRP